MSPACLLLVSLRSGPVTAVEFAGPNTVASSSEDGSTKFWDVRTGQETTEALPEVPEGFAFSKQGGAKELLLQRSNGYVVIAKGRTLFISKATADGKAEPAPVAFFQCAAEIKGFDVAGAKVAVGCADGQVLQLFAAVLQK